jgi:hypothetical protein
MKKQFKLSSLILIGLFVGCSTITVIPNSDGTFNLEASSNTEPNALNDGIKAATESCKKDGKSLSVISHSTKYTGEVDPNAKALFNTTASIVNMNSSNKVQEQDTSQDYTVSIKFKCI